MQRSSTLVTNIEPSAQLAYATYNEGTLEDNDLIATSMPLVLARRSHQMLTAQSKTLDQDLLDGLERIGFKLDFGEDGTGWQFKYLTRGGGYYFNVGCSDLLVSGAIKLIQFTDIDGFVADGARMKNGATIPADLIVLATGYKRQEVLVREAVRRRRRRTASARSGASATARSCATCIPARRSPACGSSPAASRNAASTRNIWRCRSRRSRQGCCRMTRAAGGHHPS